MTYSKQLLNELKIHLGNASDYRVSKALGVTRSCISTISVGRSQFSDETLIDIAKLLNVEPCYLIAKMHVEKSKSPELMIAMQQILDYLPQTMNNGEHHSSQHTFAF